MAIASGESTTSSCRSNTSKQRFAPAVAPAQAESPVSPGAGPTVADVEPGPAETQTATATAARVHAATVERGRIASLAGVVSIIWLVILVLMVWRP